MLNEAKMCKQGQGDSLRWSEKERNFVIAINLGDNTAELNYNASNPNCIIHMVFPWEAMIFHIAFMPVSYLTAKTSILMLYFYVILWANTWYADINECILECNTRTANTFYSWSSVAHQYRAVCIAYPADHHEQHISSGLDLRHIIYYVQDLALKDTQPTLKQQPLALDESFSCLSISQDLLLSSIMNSRCRVEQRQLVFIKGKESSTDRLNLKAWMNNKRESGNRSSWHGIYLPQCWKSWFPLKIPKEWNWEAVLRVGKLCGKCLR